MSFLHSSLITIFTLSPSPRPVATTATPDALARGGHQPIASTPTSTPATLAMRQLASTLLDCHHPSPSLFSGCLHNLTPHRSSPMPIRFFGTGASSTHPKVFNLATSAFVRHSLERHRKNTSSSLRSSSNCGELPHWTSCECVWTNVSWVTHSQRGEWQTIYTSSAPSSPTSSRFSKTCALTAILPSSTGAFDLGSEEEILRPWSKKVGSILPLSTTSRQHRGCSLVLRQVSRP